MRVHVTYFCVALLALALATTLKSEEIKLKNGTQVTGTIVAVEGDLFRVKTDYGEMQIPRSDLVSISFPDGKSSSGTSAKTHAPVDEALTGTSYTNRTAGFGVQVPAGWLLAPELREKQPDIVAALKAPDQSQFFVVTPETFAGNLATYEVFCETQYQSKFENYKRAEKSDVQLDGKSGIRLVFEGTPTGTHINLEFLVYIIQHEDRMVRLSFWTLEPLFQDSLPVFEKIASSYKVQKPVSIASINLILKQSPSNAGIALR